MRLTPTMATSGRLITGVLDDAAQRAQAGRMVMVEPVSSSRGLAGARGPARREVPLRRHIKSTGPWSAAAQHGHHEVAVGAMRLVMPRRTGASTRGASYGFCRHKRAFRCGTPMQGQAPLWRAPETGMTVSCAARLRALGR